MFGCGGLWHASSKRLATRWPADGAKAALSILATDQPIDLLFSDIVIPGEMDGRELARAALALRPALRVVLTSGYPASALPAGKQTPRASLLSKPYRREELIRTVQVAIEESTR
jgi:CheY-like chemotaxis protein